MFSDDFHSPYCAFFVQETIQGLNVKNPLDHHSEAKFLRSFEYMGAGSGGRGQGAGKDCMCSSEPWTCTKKTVSSVLECLGELFGPQVGQEYC